MTDNIRFWLRFLLGNPEPPQQLPAMSGGLTLTKAVAIGFGYLAVNFVVATTVLMNSPPSMEAAFSLVAFAFAVFLGTSASLALVILVAKRVIGADLMLRSEEDAAWVPGTSQDQIGGAVLGLCFGVMALGFLMLFPPTHEPEWSRLLSRVATTPGLSALFWWPTMVIIAPLGEELLFRGLLLGALTKRTGKVWATAIVTVAFVGIHFRALASHPPIAIPLFIVGTAAAVLRFRTRAVGPAVFLHLSYNLFLGLIAVLAVQLQ